MMYFRGSRRIPHYILFKTAIVLTERPETKNNEVIHPLEIYYLTGCRERWHSGIEKKYLRLEALNRAG
jgi:hypothetical protein